MKRTEAIEIAKRYNLQTQAYKRAMKENDRPTARYHEGLMCAYLQVFEMFNVSHGYSTPARAVKDANAVSSELGIAI